MTAAVITHRREHNGIPWHDVQWNGRSEQVFDGSEWESAMAYALALETNGRPLVDEEEDA